MKYTPTECPKCGATLTAPGRRGGRPSRWCCDGCQRSGEAEMARLNFLLKKFEEGRGIELLNAGRVLPRRQQVITEMQARYDHLAGVPAGET
jgi:hypothetical protein